MLDELKKREESAYQKFIRFWTPKIYNYALTCGLSYEDAEDLFQGLLIKLIRHLDSIRDESGLASWIWKVTRNSIIDFHRKQASARDHVGTIVRECEIESREEPEEDSLANTPNPTIALLKKIILDLPPAERNLINLRYYYNHTEREMSELLGLPVGSIKSILSRSRKSIRDRILKQGV